MPTVDAVVVPAGPRAVARCPRRHRHAPTAEVVALALATTEPLDPGWLARVSATLTDDVVAAGPVAVHPRRRLRRATPHDGAIRAAGVSLAEEEGVPVVRSNRAGDPVGAGGPPRPVDALPAVAVVFDRAAYDAAGGLGPSRDLDVAIVDLCTRLRAGGGSVVVVPDVLVVDHRPVASRAQLLSPIDETNREWRRAIDRAGPRFRRPGPPRIALTTAVPSP